MRILLYKYATERFNIQSTTEKAKYLPQNQLIYKYSKSISFKKLVSIINYIFLAAVCYKKGPVILN